jgi:hypothetical protein
VLQRSWEPNIEGLTALQQHLAGGGVALLGGSLRSRLNSSEAFFGFQGAIRLASVGFEIDSCAFRVG